MGPYQLSGSYSGMIIPMQQTSFSVMMARPADELKYYNLLHKIPVSATTSLMFSGGYTQAQPGFTLSSSDIESKSVTAEISAVHQFIRLRTENLSGKITLDMRNSSSDISDNPLTRDNIRTLRAGINYDFADNWQGYNFMGFTLSQGLNIFGAHSPENPYISRLNAKADFTKLELYYKRQQQVYDQIFAALSLSGQIADGSLYSSEEFGYGGISYGKAYDNSEISGDEGFNGSLEFSYNGLDPVLDTIFIPYTFYDFGKIWNRNSDQESGISGSSAGIGLRAYSDLGFSLDIAVAQPLTREISTPISGGGSSPRYLFQITYSY